MCNNYLEKDLKKKYNRKRKQTLNNRNVGWELSFEDYKTLKSKQTNCDYTGLPFSEDDIRYFASIERIDKNLPYRKDNCCMVTTIANQLKDSIEEGDEGNLRIKDLELVKRIKSTLSNKTRLELAGKYFPELLSEEQESSKEEKIIMSKQDETTVNKHLDVEVARYYAEFSINEDDFQVSFATFKRKYLKTKCELSGKVFDKDNHYLNKKITKKDYTKPFSDDNIQVMCLVFDNMLKNDLFTKKELLKVANNF